MNQQLLVYLYRRLYDDDGGWIKVHLIHNVIDHTQAFEKTNKHKNNLVYIDSQPKDLYQYILVYIHLI